MTAGATGILFTRWRPLLDGPLFGAFGPMGMDGSVTPQAEMASKLARWTNSHADIWKSRPVQGRRRNRLRAGVRRFQRRPGQWRRRRRRGGGGGGGGEAGGGANYVQSAQGAYQAFFDSNIQADFVGIDDIGEYPMIYLPYPEMLRKATADKLRDYVAKGGKLVSEGCPGYFGDGGTVGAVQPNLGLDQLFGARETYVQFTPDLLGKLTLTVRDKQIGGQYFLQEYQAGGRSGGGPVRQRPHRRRGAHLRQRQDAVDRHFPGRQLLPESRGGNARILRRTAALGGHPAAGAVQRRGGESPAAQGAGGTYLWVVNPTRTARNVKISLPSPFQRAVDLWQESSHPTISGNTLAVTVEDRNAAVIRLEAN